jgi:membrane associated rhomboid family serine protease
MLRSLGASGALMGMMAVFGLIYRQTPVYVFFALPIPAIYLYVNF